MKKLSFLFIITLSIASAVYAAGPLSVSTTVNKSVWPSQPPADNPFAISEDITAVTFTGRYAQYANADTWYPSWASDDKLYSPYADGQVGDFYTAWMHKTTGQARVEGSDPFALDVISLGVTEVEPAPYGGIYPCGSLVKDNIWFYGYYALDNLVGNNWTVQGPFVGFRISTDFGKTWTIPLHTTDKPLFGESSKQGDYLKFGAPHIVDFGKNMQHSPDGYAYIVGHGASKPDPKPREVNLNWIVADQLYMARVIPSVNTINDPNAYQFFAGLDKNNKPIWSSTIKESKPLVDWNNNCGCVTMTYNPGLKKYLMCITDGQETLSTMNTYILESDNVTGPFKLAVYMKDFGPQAYFVNIPSKFISEDGKTAWLCYSANFTPQTLPVNPPGSGYCMTLQEIELSTPEPKD